MRTPRLIIYLPLYAPDCDLTDDHLIGDRQGVIILHFLFDSEDLWDMKINTWSPQL